MLCVVWKLNVRKVAVSHLSNWCLVWCPNFPTAVAKRKNLDFYDLFFSISYAGCLFSLLCTSTDNKDKILNVPHKTVPTMHWHTLYFWPKQKKYWRCSWICCIITGKSEMGFIFHGNRQWESKSRKHILEIGDIESRSLYQQRVVLLINGFMSSQRWQNMKCLCS